MKALKYFAWNAIIIGTLASGYFLNCMKGTGLAVGILYGVLIIPCYVLITALHATKTVREALAEANLSMEWTMVFEPVFIALVIYMGYHKLGVAMISETLMHTYLCIATKEAKKEASEKKVENDPV